MATPTFPLGEVLWWALANPSCVPNLKSQLQPLCKYWSGTTKFWRAPLAEGHAHFLQRGRIACNAERCNTYSNSVCPSVRPSVRPSVTRWYPIQTNEHRITQSSLWGSKNTLVFWYQQWLGGDDPFQLKFALKVTHPLWNAPSSTNICL